MARFNYYAPQPYRRPDRHQEALFHGFRVEDATSRAQWTSDGIISGSDTSVTFSGRTSEEKQELRMAVENHLNWYSSTDTPFISVYGDRNRAFQEARRRVNNGAEDVVVYEINVPFSLKGHVQFRLVPKLMRELSAPIPEMAVRNAEFEFIFLHHIPPECIVGEFMFYV